MLDIKYIRENPDKIKQGCQNKQVKCDIDRLLELDKQRRKIIQEAEGLKAEQNKLGKDDQEKAKEIKNKIKELEPELKKVGEEFNSIMKLIPNMPLDDVIKGKSEEDNKIIRQEGEKTKFDFDPKDYLDIAENLDLIDVKRAAKASGTRFGYLKGGAVLLEFALIQLAFNTLIKEKFIPVIPPVMLNRKSMDGMGYLDRGIDEVYHLEKDDLFLVGTSEQSIGAMHMDEIFEEKDLPRRYVGFSTCFRREAGASGKDTRGILRVHQFDKTEMFVFCKPEDSFKEHKLLLAMEEKLMKMLELPYQVIDICSADLGDPAAKKWDIEVWMPGQNQYRETHSTSNCTDFQARRLNTRYKSKDGVKFVHTLNGTAFSQRPILAIIENYQQKDGSVKVPEVLQPYMGGMKVIG
ncbi:serine--tRNA ligase [Patescibacteria group bacterium]|nr:serine--tRNA ligase [Patescibacteria group bacterium]MBU1563469.1 serine--tRNA ligase [Patescibacteria group bacterium]MBU2068574.1 serine--tRNA ligase [Patescibacteria group bacterium]